MDPNAPVEVGEVKLQNVDGTAGLDAVDQVSMYVGMLEDHGVSATRYLGGFLDRFRVRLQKCGPAGINNEVWFEYTTTLAEAGVFLVTREPRTRSCGLPPEGLPGGQEEQEDVPEEEQEPSSFVDCMADAGGVAVNAARWVGGKAEAQLVARADVPLRAIATSTTAATAAEVATLEAAVVETTAATAGASAVLGVGAVVAGVVLGVAIACALDPNVWGDPHLVTLDGLTYDLQTAGEFRLLRDPASGLDVQGRFVGAGSGRYVSVLDSVAVTSGFDRIEFSRDGTLLVNGDSTELSGDGWMELGDGSMLFRSGKVRLLALDEPSVLIKFDRGVLSVRFGGNPPSTEGLLGNNDGDASNDLRLADGTQLPMTSTAAALFGSYANSWRINDAESLFTYGPGEGTDTFTDLTYPSNVATIGDFPADDIEVAATVCRSHEVSEGPAFDDCVYDVLVTGDDEYASAAVAVPDTVVDPLAKVFDASGHLVEDFTAPVAANFAAPLYLNDPETSRVAGPFFEGKPYTFYQLNVPRHDDVQMNMRLVAYGDVDTGTPTQSVDVVIDGRAPVAVALAGQQGTYDGPGSLQFVRSGTTAAGTPFDVYDLSMPVAHYGSALKVRLEPKNFRSIQGTSLGVNRVELTIAATPSQDFISTMPLTVSPDSPTGAGRLETGGAEDNYAIAVSEVVPGSGLADLYLQRNRSLGLDVQLIDSSGQTLLPRENSSAHLRFNQVPAGEYTVRVRGTRPTAYSLAATVVPEPVTTPSSIDGPEVVLETDAPGQEGWVSFSGTQGQRVQLQASGYTYASKPTVRLYRPNGAQLWSALGNGLMNTTVLPETGTYLVFLDPLEATVGSMTFKAWSVP